MLRAVVSRVSEQDSSAERYLGGNSMRYLTDYCWFLGAGHLDFKESGSGRLFDDVYR